MSRLLNYKSQIVSNLRRTAAQGSISLLNQRQLEDLAFKYFGVRNEYGDIIGYQCPYSAKVYTDYNDIILEHIVPVASNGGTVLFNCIPASKEVNGSDQKGAKHLIAWWTNSEFWDKEAPLRLEKIVNYMLEGYELVFNEYTVDEVENSYQDIELNESILDEEDNPSLYERTTNDELERQARENKIHSHLGFILDCKATLEKYGIDTTEINAKLASLQDRGIFEDVERYQLFQNIIKQLVIQRIGDDSHSHLTYTLNFDKTKLMNSIKSDNPEEIYNELNLRLQNIEQFLKNNNLSMMEYFKSLKDIQDIDIVYKNINEITQEDKQAFLENIKLGTDTKIEIFIEMLNDGNKDILKDINAETLKGYPNINLSHFWSNHHPKIKEILFKKEKENPAYEKARKTILDKYEVSSYEELVSKQELEIDVKIEIFIKMLNEGNSEILKTINTETLKGYPSINLSYFWADHQSKIKEIIFEKEKENPQYEVARQTILDKYDVNVNLFCRFLVKSFVGFW